VDPRGTTAQITGQRQAEASKKGQRELQRSAGVARKLDDVPFSLSLSLARAFFPRSLVAGDDGARA